MPTTRVAAAMVVVVAAMVLHHVSAHSSAEQESQTPDSVDSVPLWGQWERSWVVPARGGNPFVDVTLAVDLAHAHDAAGAPSAGSPPPPPPPPGPGPGAGPRAVTVTVRGFYDGQDAACMRTNTRVAKAAARGGAARADCPLVFRARFMAPRVGTWSFVTRSNDPGLSGKSGHFTVVSGTGAGAGTPRGHAHGPVVAAPNQTKFAYADGTPFFAVATTVYGLFINSNRTLATLRKATSPFNKVRTLLGSLDPMYENVPLPFNASNASTPAIDPTRFNMTFWRHTEARAASRPIPIPPRWRSIRFRLAPRAYDAPPWGCIVRVVSPTKPRNRPTRNALPLFVTSRPCSRRCGTAGSRPSSSCSATGRRTCAATPPLVLLAVLTATLTCTRPAHFPSRLPCERHQHAITGGWRGVARYPAGIACLGGTDPHTYVHCYIVTCTVTLLHCSVPRPV